MLVHSFSLNVHHSQIKNLDKDCMHSAMASSPVPVDRPGS